MHNTRLDYIAVYLLTDVVTISFLVASRPDLIQFPCSDEPALVLVRSTLSPEWDEVVQHQTGRYVHFVPGKPYTKYQIYVKG